MAWVYVTGTMEQENGIIYIPMKNQNYYNYKARIRLIYWTQFNESYYWI